MLCRKGPCSADRGCLLPLLSRQLATAKPTSRLWNSLHFQAFYWVHIGRPEGLEADGQQGNDYGGQPGS
jgi:hypothetical protein